MGNQTGKQGLIYTNLVGPNGTLIPIPPVEESRQTPGIPAEGPLSPYVVEELEKGGNMKGDCPEVNPEVKNLPPHCFLCQKKLGPISQFQCRCENIYCSKHFHSFNHACTFDYKKLQQEQLMKDNPRIKRESMKSKWNMG